MHPLTAADRAGRGPGADPRRQPIFRQHYDFCGAEHNDVDLHGAARRRVRQLELHARHLRHLSSGAWIDISDGRLGYNAIEHGDPGGLLRRIIILAVVIVNLLPTLDLARVPHFVVDAQAAPRQYYLFRRSSCGIVGDRPTSNSSCCDWRANWLSACSWPAPSTPFASLDAAAGLYAAAILWLVSRIDA
jgi:hypothetical protein